MLIFDADDTLWENNVIFERVIEEFLDWMERPGLGRDEVRAVLDGIEAANAVTYGYGSKVFCAASRSVWRGCGGERRTRGRPRGSPGGRRRSTAERWS